MKKFILKIVIVILPILCMNLILGVIRYKNGDETIPYRQNWYKQYITHEQKYNEIGRVVSDFQTFDMSREVRKCRMVRYKDKWGFQNTDDIKNPKIIFIGDSFFNDPFLSYQQGLSFNFERSLNIGYMGCSGFQVFNELKTHGYFTEIPKFIIIEVVERNLEAWVNLYEQLEMNQIKTIPYNYCGLDFLFGNNFKGANCDNLAVDKQNIELKKQGTLRYIDSNKKIYFLKNKISHIDSEIIKKVVSSMKKVSQYFIEKNCQVIYVVAPDKESIFPELFPKSNLSAIQKQFDSQQISYIDMYKKIMESPNRKTCYYDGDTHWNLNAYNILIEEIKFKISNNE
jgi:hypothetical protein